MKKSGNKNTFYLTNRHNAIKERVKGWEKQRISHSHWQGFDIICTENNKKKDAKKSIPYSILCKTCPNKKTCKYPNQFKAKDRIFAPSSYLSTTHFKDKIKSMKTVIIDESITNIDTCTIKPKIVEDAFRTIKVTSTYMTKIQQQDYYWFASNHQKRIKHIRIQLNNYIQNPKSDLSKIKGFNLGEFEKFLEWYNIYFLNQPSRTSFGVPLYYYAFDALKKQKNLKLVILDASFNKRLFQYFLY